MREHDVPTHPLYEQRLHVDRLRAVHARDRAGRGPAAPGAGGGRRTRRRSAASTARSRPAGSSTSCTRCSGSTMSERRARSGEAREVALAEAQAVLAMARDETMRGRLADARRRRRRTARSRARTRSRSRSCSSSGCRPAGMRALYGPGGEQAALTTLRRLPRGAAVAESAREVTSALRALAGRESTRSSSRPSPRARSRSRSRRTGSR